MYGTVTAAVEGAGLAVRGGFHPGPGDGVPKLRGGSTAGTLILVGNVGSGVWEPFAAAGFLGRTEHPLDDWSREVVSNLGRGLGAEPLFPFGGPPFLPFIRWALRADTVWPSVMGPLIHPRYGLWHAYRGALSFPGRFDLPPRDRTARRPCDDCVERPCLAPCPVGAVREGDFDAPGCADWLTDQPRCECRRAGCLARRACPIGRGHAYAPAHAAFHMTAFAKANATPRQASS